MDGLEHTRRIAEPRIIRDDAILGGTPVIRGTRITVYSVLSRIEGGDSLDDLVQDNPDLPREAFEEAVAYARVHPLAEAPDGKPWRSQNSAPLVCK